MGTSWFADWRVMHADVELDVRKLACPLPILRAKKSLSAMTDGQILRVLATDPESPKDFAVFCRQTRNELIDSVQDGEVFTFWIRRG